MRQASLALAAMVLGMVPAAAVGGVPVVTGPGTAVPVADATIGSTDAPSCDADGGYAIAEEPAALHGYDVERIWQRATGRGIRVAVVDSGLAVANPHFDAGDGVPAYAEGVSLLTPEVSEQYEDVYDENGWLDPDGHGTAVAGIIAARAVESSESRVVGLAPEATIVPVQVFGLSQSSRDEDADLIPDVGRLAEGIRWAADSGAEVIAVAMSVAEPDERLAEAVEHAVESGALVVASAGSAATAPDEAPGLRYPAAYPGVLGVTAVDESGRPGELVFAGEHVDVAAPGQQVATAYRDLLDCYLGEDPAPSFAVGYVAATAALIAEHHPEEGAQQWSHRILMSANRAQQGTRTDQLGWGVLSPYDALTMTIDPARPGPAAPGHDAARTDVDQQAPGAVVPDVDRWVEARDVAVPVAVAGVGVLVVAAVAGSLLRRPQRTR